MMPTKKLVRLVIQNSMRNRGEFVLSAFGIVVGIAAFVFFIGLSLGVRAVVLGEMFPLDVVEVIAPRASLLGVNVSQKLDDDTVEKIRARPEVVEAVPRMAVGFPAIGRGWFDGNELRFELVGDGIDPSYVRGEKFSDKFKDYEADLDPATLKTCGPAPKFKCEGLYYCERRENKCHHRVPVIVSKQLLEIYNTQFAESRGMPMIGALEQFIVDRGGLSKMRVYIGLGDSMVSASNKPLLRKPRQVEAVLLGISDKAIPIGVTVPIQYVKRWNREFLGEEAALEYSSIIVRVKNKSDAAPLGAWLFNELDLRVEDQQGERFAMVIFIVTALFLLIALIIILISAINIAHNFFMQVSERRREIGLLRSLGATRSDVRRIILGEAALIGLVAGAFGTGIAVLGAKLVDWGAARYLPDFPFKPDTFFAFPWWIPAGGVIFSVLFCVLGGFLPARKAAALQPAEALSR